MPAVRGRAARFALHRGAAERGIGIQDPALAWSFDARVDQRAFELLGFAEASAGIARTQRDNREGWWAHARRSKAFILDAAARVARPRLAVLLGAGKTYDLPVRELAVRFERVRLVDIDAAALAATLHERRLGPHVEARAMDLTGVTARIARGIESALDSPDPEASLEGLCASYRLAGRPRFIEEGERADLLVSGMVLSQLGLQPKLAAKRLFERRFGKIAPESEPRWVSAWGGLERRLQQDHVDALCDQAELAVLMSDVAHRSAGESWSVIGAARIEERVPPGLEILARAAWSWPRVRGEVETGVGALLLRRRG